MQATAGPVTGSPDLPGGNLGKSRLWQQCGGSRGGREAAELGPEHGVFPHKPSRSGCICAMGKLRQHRGAGAPASATGTQPISAVPMLGVLSFWLS